MTAVRLRSTAALLATGALALGLAGCGGGSDDSASSTSSAPASSSAASSAPSSSTSGSGSGDGTAAAAGSDGKGRAVTGQRADLELTDRAENALRAGGVRWEPAGKATSSSGDEVRFPITGGRLAYTPLAGSVTTTGTAVLAKGGSKVTVAKMVVDLSGKRIRAEVDGEQQTIARLDTTEQEVEHTGRPVADVDGLDVVFTSAFTGTVHRELGVTLPTRGPGAELEMHVSRR